MVLGQLPVAKLFWLGVRQCSRPIAKVAVQFGERNERFQGWCVQASKLVPSTRLTVPHNEAVQIGCQLLGEAVVFGVTGSVLVYEYIRQKEAERLKVLEAAEASRRAASEARGELQREFQASQQELRHALGALEEELASQRVELAALRKGIPFWARWAM